MAHEGIERRLAAILSVDVVGYSRLMGADETGTLEALKAHRAEFVDPKIERHHGRIVKLMGDGALVEFASVVDAVECAIVLQRGMAERNRGVAEERRIARPAEIGHAIAYLADPENRFVTGAALQIDGGTTAGR